MESKSLTEQVRGMSDDALRRLRNELVGKFDAHRLAVCTDKVRRTRWIHRELLTEVNHEHTRRAAGTLMFDEDTGRFSRETNTVWVSPHDKAQARRRYRADRKAHVQVRHTSTAGVAAPKITRAYHTNVTAVKPPPADPGRAMRRELETALRRCLPVTQICFDHVHKVWRYKKC